MQKASAEWSGHVHRFTCPCFAINKICVLRGTFSPSGVVGFMNNAAADVKIMPVVVHSIFSLIPSPPAFFVFLWEKETVVMLDERHTGDTWPNKRDVEWDVLKKEGKKKRNFKIRGDGGKVTRGKKCISRLRYWMWRVVKQADRCKTVNWDGMRPAEWQRDRKRLKKRDMEEENCGKSSRRIGVVMRGVYQFFRWRLLIKHHQTLNLLTINTLLHYRAFSPSFFPFISPFLCFFPCGSLCLPNFPLLSLLLFIKQPQHRLD